MAEHPPIMDPTPDNPDWAGLAHGPADVASLTALAGATPDGMTGPALVDAIVASEKALSYLAAKQMRLLTAFAAPFKAGDPMRLARRLARKNCITGDEDPDQVAMFVEEAARSLAQAEVAAALRIPSKTAGHRINEATTMTGVLAPTLRALETGVLDRGKARVIAEHCVPLTPENTTKVQDLVLPAAGELNTSELREVTGQAVITVDPDGAEERHQAAATRRELVLQALPDAMASLKAYLPADGAVKIFQVSDLLATGTAGSPGDTRGIGARRVDALVDIAEQLLTNGYLDLTGYLGTELPDHGTPPTRGRGGYPDPDLTSNPDPDDADPAGDPDPADDTDTADDTAPGADGTAEAVTETQVTADTEDQAADLTAGVDQVDQVDQSDRSAPEPGDDATTTATACTGDTADSPAPSDADPTAADTDADSEFEDALDDDAVHDDAVDDEVQSDDVDADAAPGMVDLVDGPLSNDEDPIDSPSDDHPVDAALGADDRPVDAALGADDPVDAQGDVDAAPVDASPAVAAPVVAASVVAASVVAQSDNDRPVDAPDDVDAVDAAPVVAQSDNDRPVDAPDDVDAVDAAPVVAAAPVGAAPVDAASVGAAPVDAAPVASRTGKATTTTKTGKQGNPARVFTRQGRRPHLSVTLGLGTLAGLDDLPGTLAGFGAIPAGLARSIAASAATINALLTNPATGTITAAGALTYRPTQELRDQISAILNVCQFPSCRQPVWRCDMDHREEFNHEHPEQGGPTDLTNTGPMCRRHHLIKHHSEWKLRPDPDRTVLHFTSPTGHHYTKRGRQAAAPAMWITTAGTAIAERLDTITATAEVNRPPQPGSDVEELLRTILIRHALNTKPMEYQHDETAWARAAEQWNDPPPF